LRVLQGDDDDQGDQDADPPGAPVRPGVLLFHRTAARYRCGAGAQLLLIGTLISGFEVGASLPPCGSTVTITASTPLMSSMAASASPLVSGSKRTPADSTRPPRCTQAWRTSSEGSCSTLAIRSVPASPSRTISAVTPAPQPVVRAARVEQLAV